MTDKHKLTEKLKVLETKIHDHKVDLNSIELKLNSSYNYETELLERLENCRKQTEELRKQFTLKAKEISSKYKDMKNILDVFTGNFFTN